MSTFEANGKVWVRHRVHGYLPAEEQNVFIKAGNRIRREILQSRYANLFLESDHFHCPCCGVVMLGGLAHGDRATRRRRRTRGHLHPRAGWPVRAPRPWIWQCSGCNEDQSETTLWKWAFDLKHRGDPRAAAVSALADKFIEHEEIPDVR